MPAQLEEEHYDLFSHQMEGVRWLVKQKYGLLADEPGLGKSAQVIRAADLLGLKPILVLCPAVARINWTREFAKFSKRSLRCSALLTSEPPAPQASDVTICSYDLATKPAIFAALSRDRWALCVLDEAHYLKELTAGRSKAILGRGGLVHRADRCWLLTGTPAPNHPGELWTMLYVFGVTALSQSEFLDRHTVRKHVPIPGRGGFREKVVGGRNIDDLKMLIAPFHLRRKKVDVMPSLPAILFSDVVIEATPVSNDTLSICFDNYLSYPAERRWQVFYEDVAKQQKILDTLAGDIGLGNEGMTVLNGIDIKVRSLRRFIGLQKLPKVLDTIRAELDAKAYDKIVLFGVHRDVLQGLNEGLRAYGSVLLYGGTPAVKRDKIIKRFQTDPKCRVFVGNVQAAGTAINLTAAHHVAFIEADWVPSNNQQAAMRVHRIGQTMPVTVRFFGMAGSIDERIQRVLKNKTRVLTELFDSEKIFDPFAD